MSKLFWQGKRVLVTGADGFVATWLIDRLIEDGALVVGVVRHLKPVTTADIMGFNNGDLELSDLRNVSDVQRILHRHDIDTVFHLAASAIVSSAASSPMSTVENNVGVTLNVLEACRVTGVKRVVVSSSDKSYGDHLNDDNETLPYKESYTLRGLDVYSASKACADMLCHTYALQYNLPVMVSRACNIYGPGDMNFSRLIPRTTMRLLSGMPAVINAGNSHVLREYVHVSDVVNALMLMASRAEDYHASVIEQKDDPYGAMAFNIGSYTASDYDPEFSTPVVPNVCSVSEVIKALRDEVLGAPYLGDIVTAPKPASFIEIPDQYCDAGKLMKLGFVPEIKLFPNGLSVTAAWYADNYDDLLPYAGRYLGE